jgi:hypothetical protein
MRQIRENCQCAQRQQESERRGIRTGCIEGNASEFHCATFYRGEKELERPVSLRDANLVK